MGKRLNMILDVLGYTQKSFATQVGTTQSYVSNMISGARSVSKKSVAFLSEHHPEINVQWLLYNQGKMMHEVRQVTESQQEYPVAQTPIFEMAQARMDLYERRIVQLEKRVAELERLMSTPPTEDE